MVLTSPLVMYANSHSAEFLKLYPGKTVILTHPGAYPWFRVGSPELEKILKAVEVHPFDSFNEAVGYVERLDLNQVGNNQYLCLPIPTNEQLMTTKSEALETIAPAIENYLAGIAAIMRSGPAQRGIISRSIEERCKDAQSAVNKMRRTYGLPITDYEVLISGADSLKRREEGLAAGLISHVSFSVDEKEGLAATVETAITETLRSNPGITLPGLFDYAKTYQPQNQ